MENPNIVYGRLKESSNISGYSLERAIGQFEWLLEENRWKSVGSGFEDINEFLKSIKFSDFKITIDQRKNIAGKLAELQASQRATAKMLGVSHEAISKNFRSVNKLTPEEKNTTKYEEVINEDVNKLTTEEKLWFDDNSQKEVAQKKRSEKKQKEVENKIEEQKQKIKSGEISLPEGIFDIIVIDPPWPYDRKYDPETSRVGNPYPEMSIEEISNIKLTPDKDCILWFWTTHRFIWDAKDIMDKWGFEYKGILVWNKENMGMGSWLRMQCEFCLLGIKGKPLWDVKDLRDIITAKGGEHSAKPDEFYKMINVKFISKSEFKADYFGRKKRPGWKIKKD